ncbi:MAG: C4-dicarboxylate ABC transporter [Betaproteobacteria bacterium HGW-Betaproteobacteria-4]|jgi:TRAP transporter 4TM/12TM fusion protein|nr:MAG: C4-dicarboxylate ABC transporter [Betaproteobacteria bacterium HGW-Betaproteobacteria-4]
MTNNVSPMNIEQETFSEHGAQRRLGGVALLVLTGIALVFSLYQLSVAAFHPLSSLVMRALHVGFLLTLTFILFPPYKRARHDRVAPGDWLLAGAAFLLACYQWIYEVDLIQRAGDPSTVDLVVGTAMIALLFEAARRILGLALPAICAAFLLYGLFGQYLPGDLAHRGYDFAQVVDQIGFGTEGIFGIPTLVSASYIFLFVLFGAFLEHAGMINLFNSVALGFVGHTKGGAAKVAVVSSGLMGSISGSGVANVLTTGQFTIPLMKRFGYSGVFAGAVEATASMGGQIMPPVMGAVAFIMAENLNLPYVEIVKAALIPAILYYATVFWMVHLEAGRRNLDGLSKEDCPNPWQAIREQWYLVLPLAGLVGMLFNGFTPMYSGMVGLALCAILILGAAIGARLSSTAFRFVFWVAVGLGASLLVKWGVYPVLIVIALLVAACFFVQGGRDTLRVMRASLVDGARQALPVGVACAIVGIIIGILTLTGAATNFAGFILKVGEDSLFVSLLLTMLICLVLGMGIPTIPNYIITSSIAAPALLDLGVPLIVSHLFVFYFGIMADLTPPVALAAFAASSVAREPAMKIGLKAVQIAIAGFVVPFMAVYDNALMLQGDPSALAVAYIVGKALLAITLWGAASIGYLRAPLAAWERVWAALAAFLLVAALPLTDEIGFAACAAFIGWHLIHSRRLHPA